MGKRCPACRKPVAQDAVLCTNCGYDRRTRSRVLRRPDDDAQYARPHPLAFLWRPPLARWA